MESPNATDEEGFDQKPEYETICEQYSVASPMVADKSPAQNVQLLDTPYMAHQAEQVEQEVDIVA